MKKILKTIIVMTLCVSMLFTNCYAAQGKGKKIKEKQTKLSMKNVSGREYKLNEKQKELWAQVMEAYEEGCREEKEFATTMTTDEVVGLTKHRKSIKDIAYSDLTYGFGVYRFKKISYDKHLYVIFDMKNVAKMIKSSKKNEKKIDKIIKKLKLNKRTSQKKAAKKIHDYLIKKVKYDYTYKKRDISDAIYDGKSVCSGYARAYEAICDKVGLRCHTLLGDSTRGDHAWNKVKVNGVWKYVDVCWDDTAETKKYFLVSKKKISKEHFNGVIEY